jgi:hypothetical protein
MPKRKFSIVAMVSFVRKNELSKSHESIESGKDDSCKQKLVMRRCRDHAIKNKEEVGVRERTLSINSRSEPSHAACHSA